MSEGLCACGCGAPTRLAPVNDRSKGWVKGVPLKYIKGHGCRNASAIRTDRAIGNRSVTRHGYVMVTLGHGWRQYEHILVAEKAIQRGLRNHGKGNPRTEVVHHINGNKTDNRPENLLVCQHQYHTELHHRLESSTAWPEFQKVIRNVKEKSSCHQ